VLSCQLPPLAPPGGSLGRAIRESPKGPRHSPPGMALCARRMCQIDPSVGTWQNGRPADRGCAVSVAETEAELPRLRPGKYTALYERHQGMNKYKTPKVRVDFRLLEHPGLVLSRWYRVSEYRGGRISAPHHSAIMRETCAVLGTRHRHDRIPIASLRDIQVSVEVGDVVMDGEQHELADVNRYSVIKRVLGRADT
jgi:hypothetical protein